MCEIYTEKILPALLQGHNIFILGGAGTGKTTMIKHIAKDLKMTSPKKNIKITATTGIAASQFEKAETIHHFAGKFELNHLYFCGEITTH